MSVLRRLVTFENLRAISFAHSAIYLGLLTVSLLPGLEGPTTVLGWAHGLIWIGMSLLCLLAVRWRVIPFWLAVVVVVVGGVGPFAGSIAFVVASRRVALSP